MSFFSIPADVIHMIMHYLALRDLAALSRTSRHLHALVEEFGWSVYLNLDPRPSQSYAKSASSWSPRTQVRVNTTVDEQWSRGQFVARPLSDRWSGKLQPILAINSSRLLLAAGNLIYSYAFRASDNTPDDAPGVYLEGTYSISDSAHPKSDITSLTCPSNGDDHVAFVGYANGTIERLELSIPGSSTEITYIDTASRVACRAYGDCIVESLSGSSHHVLSLSSSGAAGLHPLSLSEVPIDMIDLNSRGWSSFLSTRGSRPYAAFGTSSIHPLAVHDILSSGISTTPFALLDVSSGNECPTAVYDITAAPISSPWGGSDQIVVSGWYDGFVRVHDLRSSSRVTTETAGGGVEGMPASLLPTLTFADPWSFEPIYSVSCGGGSSAHIAAGSARHSVVAFWDVRSPVKGWSVHAPGNDPSPVYSVIVDGARVFGANQSRGFVLDFGPGVHDHTYPAINPNPHVTTNVGRGLGRRGGGHARMDDNLRKVSTDSPGFYVTKYSHSRARWSGKCL